MLFRSDEPVRRTGASCTFALREISRSVTANAKVLYSTGGMGMGLLFTSVAPSSGKLLQRVGRRTERERSFAVDSIRCPRRRFDMRALRGRGLRRRRRVRSWFTSRLVRRNAPGMNEDPRNVLNELITLLMRNRVLTDTEGKNLLRKLMSLRRAKVRVSAQRLRDLSQSGIKDSKRRTASETTRAFDALRISPSSSKARPVRRRKIPKLTDGRLRRAA